MRISIFLHAEKERQHFGLQKWRARKILNLWNPILTGKFPLPLQATFSCMQRKWTWKVNDTNRCVAMGDSNSLFRACRVRDTTKWTSKVNVTMGCMTFWNSNSQATCSISLSQHARKWALHNGHHKWITPSSVWPWGIQIGQFAGHETYFWKTNFHFMNESHTLFLCSCTQWKRTLFYPMSEWQQTVSHHGACKLGHFQLTKPIFHE